jgi:condensin complex subunit 3
MFPTDIPTSVGRAGGTDYQDEARLDTMPVVTLLAFRIQDEYNNLATSLNQEIEDMQERAFMVGELLKLAVNLDYADETGRRKMFQLASKWWPCAHRT